jgi:hypothetical protein
MLKRVALLIAATAFAVPAQAQNTVDPDHLIEILDGAGFPAEYFSQEPDYRQILVSKPGNHQFLVELYDCENGKTCDTVEFFVGFPMDNPPTRDALAAYAGPHEGAEISLDRQGKPRMVMPLDLPDDGLSDAVFIERVQGFETMMNGFYGFLTGRPAAAAPVAAAAPPAEPAAPSPPAGAS